jgi:hypothetical protein
MRSLVALLVCGLISLGCGGQPMPLEPEPSGGPRLTLNDVSFLLPLPAPGRDGSLLSLADDGAMGPLLPKRLFDGLPVLVEGVKAEQTYGELRVVSVRVDPCFPGSAPPAPPRCVKQVRLVAQPLTVEDGGVTTRDATVHLFYALPDEAFAKVTATLFELDASAGDLTDGPLDVHPVIRRQGLDGPYHGKLKTRLLEVCGLATLTRVAFMAVDRSGAQWRFGAFDVVGGALVDDLIPRLPTLKVQVVQEFGSASFRNGALVPGAPNDALDTLLRETDMRFADPRTLDRALTSALRIEHPERSSPKTIDCASCHVASRARRNAERFHRVDSSGHPDFFSAPGFDLTRVDEVKDEPRALRAFGYFGRESAFSQRTINESAAVAKALEALRPAR